MNTISILASDYKQVGAFFGQTDGPTLYPGSRVNNVFYHSGDDTIKTYYSNITVSGVTVWKTRTAPIVQFGWAARNIQDISVSDLDVIHSRWSSNGSHASIIGTNQVYDVSETQTNTCNLAYTIKNFALTNVRAEGISGNLMRIVPLANFVNFTIGNVWMESQSVRTNGIYESELPVWTDTSGTAVSLEGFVIKDFYVGAVKVSQAAGNWDASSLGGLNIADTYIKSGGVTII